MHTVWPIYKLRLNLQDPTPAPAEMSLRLKILASVALGDNELADHLRAQILPGLDPPRRAQSSLVRR